MGRNNSIPSTAAIVLAIIVAIIYGIATHPWILIVIGGVVGTVIITYKHHKKVWEKNYLEALRSFSISDLDELSGIEFERFLKRLFEVDGCKVNLTKAAHDMGADLIVKRNGRTIAIQAKRYDKKVGVSAIQQVTSSIMMYKTDGGMVITNNEFTEPAIKLAKVNGIELIDGGKLENLIVDIYKRRTKKN